MADGSNLKAKIGMDTGDFEKGAKKVTKAAQSMGKEIGSSLGEVGRALGVDTGLVGDLAKNIENATTLFKGMGAAGGQAASSLTRAMAGLGGAIAGLGITAAIAAFKELNNQAAYFEQRLQGVNLAASAKAYRETYKSYLYDSSGAGEWWAKNWERTKTYFSTNAAQIFTMSFGQEKLNEANARAKQAADLASDMVDLKRKERDLGIEIQQINNDILVAQNTFRDTQASVTERKAAEATITQLITDKYAKQIALQQEMLDNVTAYNALSKSDEASKDRQAELQKNILSLQGQQQQELNSMLRMHNSINKAASGTATAAKEQAEATVLTLEAATQLVAKQRELKAIQDQNNAMMSAARFRLDGGTLANPGAANLQGQATSLTTVGLIKTEVDQESLQAAVIEWSELIEQGLMGASEALGTLIGDLINGENAWGNFAKAGIDVVADMLSTVGKAFMATGSGVIAAESALSSGNGYAALAAGAAMVALAATMKTVMSNAAANWGGGYSTSVASSAYTSGAYGPSAFGREMNVKVTGTLTANGSQLVAVLNNENDRKNYTT